MRHDCIIRPALVLSLVAGGCAAASDCRAQVDAAKADTVTTAGSHRVSEVRIRFTRPTPLQPSVESLMAVVVPLVDTPSGLDATAPGAPSRGVKLSDFATIPDARLTDAGLAAIAPAVFDHMRGLGYFGVYVVPDPAQFHVEDGVVVDTRPPGDTTLVLEITTGIVTEVRTIAQGERIPEGEGLNHPLHEKFLERSPVKAFAGGEVTEENVLWRGRIDDYTARLNRHPGRRVDVGVAASGDQPGAVSLEYQVTENRPWLLFAQVSNTGSGSGDAFREHFGFIHNDLSNDDDILTLDYQTANFEDVHALFASYDRPVGNSERLRWNVHASWHQYIAGDVGLPDFDFIGSGWEAGVGAAWNFHQHHDTFLDLVGEAKFEHIRVNNELAGLIGEGDWIVLGAAVRLERHRDQSQTDARIGIDWGFSNSAENLEALGRTDPDDDFAVLRGEATHAFYVDPYFEKDPSNQSGLAHEILLAARGQHALGHRLIPNEEMVAGGLYTVRGYPEAVTAGDTVLMGTAEYRYHIARDRDPEVQPGTLFGKPFRWQPQYAYGPVDWDLIAKVFVDAARVTNTDRLSFETDRTLVGAGVGVEFSLTRRFNVRTDLGFALVELDDAGGGNTVDAGHAELHIVVTGIY